MLPSPHGHPYYEVSQLAAFVVYVALLLAQGRRRGYPWRQWLLLVATSTLALIVGCQLVALPPGEWLGWLRGNATLVAAVVDGPRSILGGATASLLAVVAVRRALGFRGWGVLDTFGAPLCWALAVQCVGCLLVGCCWGEAAVSGSSWALAYGPGALPYLVQQAQGLLPVGAAHSLPVVPVQGYALLLCAGAGLVLHAVRRRAGWPPGSRYLLALGLLLLIRFTIDFWRDPASEPLGGAALSLAGCTLLQVQWLMLLGAALTLGSWAWLVRQPMMVSTPAGASKGQPTLVALGLLAATTRLASGTLSVAETLLLQALLLAVLLAEARAGLLALGRHLPRLVSLPLGAVLAIVLVANTAQTPAPQQTLPSDDPAPTKTIIFSGGVLGNYHETEQDILETSVGCSGAQPLALQQRVRGGGVEIAVEKATSATRTSTWGGGVWLGQQQVDAQPVPTTGSQFITNRDTTFRHTLVDMHLYREVHTGQDWTSIGLRAGLHVGSLGYYSYFDDGNAKGSAFLMPELMLSLGNPRLLYGQADICYGAENTLGAYTGRLALGSGLGQVGGSQLLVGYARSPHQPSPHMAFASASLRLPSSTGLSALSLEPYFATDLAKHNIFSLKASYCLGK